MQRKIATADLHCVVFSAVQRAEHNNTLMPSTFIKGEFRNSSVRRAHDAALFMSEWIISFSCILKNKKKQHYLGLLFRTRFFCIERPIVQCNRKIKHLPIDAAGDFMTVDVQVIVEPDRETRDKWVSYVNNVGHHNWRTSQSISG